MPTPQEIHDHQRWLGYLQPDGLVVSPAALVDSGAVLDNDIRPLQQRLLEHLRLHQSWDGEAAPLLHDLPAFLTDFLGWRESDLLSGNAIPQEFTSFLPVFQEALRPTHAVTDPDHAGRCLLLIQETTAADLDQIDPADCSPWQASPAARFERLLRDARVPIGLLTNATHLRLIHAPPGENPGSLTFPLAGMTEVPGRPVLAGFQLLLSAFRLFQCPENESLPALLRKTREYQAHVSTSLASQVLASLYELHRGLLAAHAKSDRTLLRDVLEENPEEIYGAQLNVLMRLVFLLFAEDRALMPDSTLYLRNYSIHQLYTQLREDHELYPDTMDLRYGAWARLLSVFRMVHAGCEHPDLKIPARAGYLFDPARFPFLEARDSSGHLPATGLPKIPDSTIHRILRNLLYLKGEKLSYRTLDVEQIGSVYENIMGFQVRTSPGLTIALKPKKSHGAPVHTDLDALLAAKPADRAKILAETADTKLPAAAEKLLKAAATPEDLLAALEKRIDRRATPHTLPPGSIILQPTDERRRSGSHYTPKSFTNPIVRKTLEPILARLHSTPSNQKSTILNQQSSISSTPPLPEAILNLKVADIAVGSAAFLVETCRQLARELVSSWEYHRCTPVIPPDEDTERHAMRLVAQRCLYGVDRNPMAVDLAKLSLWLATMAKDHPFTFLDHAIKCGDSLVGLTNRQIAAFHWDPSQANDRIFGQEKLEQQIAKVAEQRKRILDWTEDTESTVLKKRDFLDAADSAAASLKTTGDLVIAAYFAGEKPKQRQQNRDEFLHRHLELQKGDAQQIPWEINTLKQLRGGEFPIRPFHWEIEFPEVFYRENPGFDAIVGNPPFADRTTIFNSNRDGYPDFLQTLNPASHGNADLVAHFFRRAYGVLRSHACLGLISTNTIAQGDTRTTGLYWIVSNGGTIFAAKRRVKWPGEAAVVVSVVWIARDTYDGRFLLDDKEVGKITAHLFHAGGNEDPARLTANADKAFQGCVVVGMGFTFDGSGDDSRIGSIEEMELLVAKDSSNKEIIFPYIGGEELSNHPCQMPHRWIINFSDYPLRRSDLVATWTDSPERTRRELLRSGIVPKDYPGPVAADWPDLLKIVETRVRPEREGGGKKLSPSQAKRAEIWWQYASQAKDLYSALSTKKRALTVSRVGNAFAWCFLPANYIMSDRLVVVAEEKFAFFALVQTRLHDAWSRLYGASLKDDLLYTPTDCFQTFPFPPGWETNGALEEAGRSYYEYRAALMVRNDEGLTDTYNRFHDPEETEKNSPDIHHLRALHAAMDCAVLAAYGWTDIPTACEFLLDYEEDSSSSSSDDSAGASDEGSTKKRKKKKPYRYRWPDEIRDEVLAKLLALNAERAEQERLAGTAKAKGKKAAKKQPINRPKRDDELI